MGTNLAGANGNRLVAGANQVAEGNKNLAGGLAALSGNSSTLNQGAGKVAAGASAVNKNAAAAAGGADQLGQGAAQLNSGAQELNKGANSLRSGLSDAYSRIPADPNPAAHARALSSPVGVASSGGEVSTTTSLAPGAIAAALWIGSLMSVLALGKMKRERIFEAATPLRLAWESLRPSLIMSLGQCVAAAAAMWLWDVDVADKPGAFAMMLFASVAFTIVNDALMAVFARRGGVIASLTLLAVQILSLDVILPSASHTGFFGAVNGSTPLPGAASALHGLITGGPSSASAAAIVLGVWAAAAFGLSVAGVKRRRATSVSAIRRELAQAAAV